MLIDFSVVSTLFASLQTPLIQLFLLFYFAGVLKRLTGAFKF